MQEDHALSMQQVTTCMEKVQQKYKKLLGCGIFWMPRGKHALDQAGFYGNNVRA